MKIKKLLINNLIIIIKTYKNSDINFYGWIKNIDLKLYKSIEDIMRSKFIYLWYVRKGGNGYRT
jgi:hypothetical protein